MSYLKRKVGFRMDESLYQAKDEFFSQRINHHRKHEPPAVNDAYMDLRSCVERLRETLSGEQSLLLRNCENAYHLSDGEFGRFFYAMGWNDAIRFLLDGRDA